MKMYLSVASECYFFLVFKALLSEYRSLSHVLQCIIDSLLLMKTQYQKTPTRITR